MEGVGARLGRSSSRYGTTTVFTGPVRRWKKKWVQVPPRSNHHNSAASASASSAAAASQQNSSVANGVTGNGSANPSSHLVLYRWTPISKKNGENENPNPKEDDLDPDSASADEPPRRKFRYVPVAALEEENKVTEENIEDEAKLVDTDDTNVEEPISKSDAHNEKPDINDVPMEENQASEEERQDLNVSTLDLSLGFTSRGGEQGSDLNMEPADDE